jgi:pilus assembly protein Flp/PilA
VLARTKKKRNDDRGQGGAMPFKVAPDRGASAVEYGLLVAAIAAVIVGVVFGLGALVNTAFDKTCNSMVAGGIAGSCVEGGTTPTTTPTTTPPAGG